MTLKYIIAGLVAATILSTGDTSVVYVDNNSPLLGFWEIISVSHLTEEEFQREVRYFGRQGIGFYADGAMEMDYGSWHEHYRWKAKDGVITLYGINTFDGENFVNVRYILNYHFLDDYLILIDENYPDVYTQLRRFTGIWFEPILYGRWVTPGLFHANDPRFDPSHRGELIFFEDGAARIISDSSTASNWTWYADESTITFYLVEVIAGRSPEVDTMLVHYQFRGQNLVIEEWSVNGLPFIRMEEATDESPQSLAGHWELVRESYEWGASFQEMLDDGISIEFIFHADGAGERLEDGEIAYESIGVWRMYNEILIIDHDAFDLYFSGQYLTISNIEDGEYILLRRIN